jgi:hypothetical protein
MVAGVDKGSLDVGYVPLPLQVQFLNDAAKILFLIVQIPVVTGLK